MKRFAVIFLLSIIICNSHAQVNRYGTPVSKSYTLQVTHGAEQNWAIIKDKFGAVYFANDDNEVIRFDGTKWTTIPLNPDNPTPVRSLGIDNKGIIYVGGANEFGYIEPDRSGKPAYISLTARFPKAKDITFSIKDTVGKLVFTPSKVTIGDLQSIIVKDSTVYFLSKGLLILLNPKNDSLSYINLKKLGYRNFERIFLINGKIILANNIQGLFELKNDKIIKLPGGGFFGFKICEKILPYQANKLFVATVDQGYFLYDYSSGTVDSTFIARGLFDKLKKTLTLCGTKLSTGEFVLGTSTDGAYVFDKNLKFSGRWTSKNTEMMDDVITAMYSDPESNSELWISTTGSITKMYVNLPFTQLSEKAGISGGVNNFTSFDGSIYVGTDRGLFKSSIDNDGCRTFTQVDDINSQIFPLYVSNVENDSFLLAGAIKGVYRINKDGRSSLLPFIKYPTRTIFQSRCSKNKFFIGGQNNTPIRILAYKSGMWISTDTIKNIPGVAIKICESENGDIFVLTNSPDCLYRIPANESNPIKYSSDTGIPESGLNYLTDDNGNLIVSTNKGLLMLNKKDDKWEPCDNITGGYTKNKSVEGICYDPEGDLWVSTQEDRYYDLMFSHKKDSLVKYKSGALALLPDLKFLYAGSIDGRVWFTKSKSIYIIDGGKINEQLPEVQTLLTKIVFLAHGKDSVVMNGTFYIQDKNGKRYPVISNLAQKVQEFQFRYNSPSFSWTTPYMVQEEDILYSHMLEGFDNSWSKWDKVGFKEYTNLSFGKYTFRVRAKTATNIESKEADYTFIILKPWYLTPWMIIIYAIAVILSIIGIIAAYTRRLKNENIRLEGIVAERTAVVVKQKEELESSIHYASRIQMALLPSQKILSENIRNYFILFKPRDIVSGDFYWMTKKGERLYIVAADCTGHGVPGAFMSLLGMSFLDEIIGKQPAPPANYILNQLRHHVTDSLKQSGGDDEAKDGMDMALLVIDFNNQKVEFSGAYNPCFRVRKLNEYEAPKYEENSTEKPDGSMSNGKYLLETIYASKMPIGISSRMNEDFIFYDWALEKGVSYYLFSDGYIDQFGGEHGRKFMKKNFKKLILEIQDYPMDKQKELLEKNLKSWMGQSPQIDDILVMGIRTE
ncbi:MAG: SpoIIE family protein phosphatase [Bacteroidales bacterium]|jgi:serine phosphatase RsbU (regulator of sigma subunit)/ligand-binding sensor domain-containing protein